MDDDNNKRRIPQKSVVTIRFLVGIYLLYIDYSLIEGVKSREGWERILIIAFMVLFLAAGGFLTIYSGKLLWEDWERERNEKREQEEREKEEKAARATGGRSIAENAAAIAAGDDTAGAAGGDDTATADEAAIEAVGDADTAITAEAAIEAFGDADTATTADDADGALEV